MGPRPLVEERCRLCDQREGERKNKGKRKEERTGREIVRSNEEGGKGDEAGEA